MKNAQLIPRAYNLGDFVKPGKALILYGPRRVGKTTLLQQFLATTSLKFKLDSGDNIMVREILGSQHFPKILEYVEGYELLVLDEAQYIPHIGTGLKILVDQRPDLALIATGSSSFELAGQVGEPLTGRKRTLTLYPIAQLELAKQYNRFELRQQLTDILRFGSYPEVLTAKTTREKQEILQEIVQSYLLKDILALERIKGPKVLYDLLKLLAFQIGSEVSLNELGTQLSLDVKTVQRYLDLLEKTFIIARLSGFSRNLRKEVSSKQKYFFLDLGIRNAIVAQLNPLELRNDVGALWENFVIMERMKKRAYNGILANTYFWRTYDQQEIDLVEEREGRLFGYECKWTAAKTVLPPKDWQIAYPQSSFAVINPDTVFDFIM